MTEAPTFAPALIDDSIPSALSPDQKPRCKHDHSRYPPPVNHANFPEELIGISDEKGIERAKLVEIRLLNILTPYTMIFKSLKRNEFGSEEDKNQQDLSGILVNGEWVIIQGKSDRVGIVDYKHEIAAKIFGEKKPTKRIKPGRENKPKQINMDKEFEEKQLIGQWAKEAAVSEYLTDRRIVLLNGTQYKSDEDIMESFYPQLDRILTRMAAKDLQGTNVFGDYQSGLGLEGEIVQVFPSATQEEQLTLPPAF